jgi:endonuclease-3
MTGSGSGLPKAARAASVKKAPKKTAKALLTTAQVRACYKKLIAAHPDAHCELIHENPFQLIVATALSAQSTDVQVNKVTPGLFKKFPTPERLAKAEAEQVEACINSLGMFRQTAKNLIGLAQGLVRDHQGQVPADLDALVQLPGVGRKTANVVLGVAFGAPVGVVVDTHVQRITQRLGFSAESDVLKIEQDLMRHLPRKEWDRVSHTLIFHGRRICDARKPACSTCPVNRVCLHAFDAEDVGRKPKRLRP